MSVGVELLPAEGVKENTKEGQNKNCSKNRKRTNVNAQQLRERRTHRRSNITTHSARIHELSQVEDVQ